MNAELFRLHGELRLPIRALAITCGICAALLVGRSLWALTPKQLYLGWNLFLACVPVVFALLYAAAESTKAPRWKRLGFALAWLFFLPNAPYILTDLVHLRSWRHPVYWNDLSVILLFAWTGAFAGFVSMFIVHRTVVARHGAAAGWVFVLAIAGLCAIGVHLGRFERWNTWDLVVQPFSILHDVWRLLIGASSGRAFVALFAAIVALGYATLYSLVGTSVAGFRRVETSSRVRNGSQ